MIPKKIHYCWFGGSPMPREVFYYIETWKKFCPDYEIKEWNEQNFDVNMCQYTQEAYQHKKWAFVSDVARVFALNHEGGIYLDTDVEIISSLDSLLDHKGFLGFEGTSHVATNIIACEKGNPIICYFLEEYKHRSFIKRDGTLDETTNVEELTRLLVQREGLILNGERQSLQDFEIYPTDVFSPYDYLTGKLHKTCDTKTIHWFSQSWIKQNPWKRKLIQFYHRLVGVKVD